MSESLDVRYARVAHANHEDKVRRVVARLRAIADEVEREGLAVHRPVPENVSGAHTFAASRVMHAIAWGMANANLGDLATAAAEADRAAEAAQ